MIKAALVLEGGSMRSLYTSGVLDVFMENNIEFECIIGVSAGALNAGNYIAKHIGRSAKMNLLHSSDSNYYGLKQFLLRGSVFNFDYIFYEPMKSKYPYNEKALQQSKQRYLVGTTNISTGKVEYFESYRYDELCNILKASSSMPFICKPVEINGQSYLDGAIADPIPLHKAIKEGYEKIVLVLTRDIDYRSKKGSLYANIYCKVNSKKLPEFVKVIANRPQNYNEIIAKVNLMEKEKKIFVFRPQREVTVKRLEKNTKKLIELYFQGREDTRSNLSKMYEYINETDLAMTKKGEKHEQ